MKSFTKPSSKNSPPCILLTFHGDILELLATIPNDVSKEKIIDRLLPLTQKYYHRFMQCSDCEQIYWRRSHYKHMARIIRQLLPKYISKTEAIPLLRVTVSWYKFKESETTDGFPILWRDICASITFNMFPLKALVVSNPGSNHLGTK